MVRDIPGQGGGVRLFTVCSKKTARHAYIPGVVRDIPRSRGGGVVNHCHKDTDRMHNPRGTDIPGQGGGVSRLPRW